MIKQKIENILNPVKIKKIRNDFQKAKNSFAIKIINKDNDLKIIDLSKELNKNDIVFFQEGNGEIVKAVITAKGINGITGRDINKEKVKVRYSSILNWKKK